MIQPDLTNTDVDGDDFEGEDMNINATQQALMFDILFKQMYRKPIPSIVREITSNCFDSHIEAEVDDPVIVSILEDEGGGYISFRDVGIGISPERMKETYSKPMESTKRNTNGQIGYFGLGSKSPFAYTDNFFLTTRVDGIEYAYLVHKGKSKPRIDKLYEVETEEHNGTEVKIYFVRPEDKNTFIDACKSELVYFDNVYFTGALERYLKNVYEVYEYNTFKSRSDISYNETLHLCIGKVSYPIDWGALGINPIIFPGGLKFNIGDLVITPERESVRYIDITDKDDNKIGSTKETILAKIEEFKEEIKKLYEDSSEKYIDDLGEYMRTRSRPPSIQIEKRTIDVSKFVTAKKTVWTPLKDFKGIIPDNPLFEYGERIRMRKGQKNQATTETYTLLKYDYLEKYLCLRYPDTGKLSIKKNQYFYDYAHENFGVIQFSLIDDYTMKPKRFLEYVGLDRRKWAKLDYSETNLRQQVLLYREAIRKEVYRMSFDYESFIIPDDWLLDWKIKNKKHIHKNAEEILVHDLGRSTIMEGKVYENPDKYKKFKGIIIYGFEEDEDVLKAWRNILMESKYGVKSNDYKYNFTKRKVSIGIYKLHPFKLRLIKIAKRNEKFFVKLKNSIYVDDFMGNNKVFKRFATTAMVAKKSKALRITGYAGHANHNPINFNQALEYIFTPAYAAMSSLRQNMQDFGESMTNGTSNNNEVNSLVVDILDVAEQYDLYDKDMLKDFTRLEDYTKGLELLNHVVINDKSLHLVAEFINLKGKPVNKFWNDPNSFEYSLVRDSIAKLEYQIEVNEEGYKTRQATYPMRQLFEKKLVAAKENMKYLQSITKYDKAKIGDEA